MKQSENREREKKLDPSGLKNNMHSNATLTEMSQSFYFLQKITHTHSALKQRKCVKQIVCICVFLCIGF